MPLFLRLSLVVVFSLIVACSHEPHTHRFGGQIMGTTYSVVLIESEGAAVDDPEAYQDIESSVSAVLRSVDEALSTYKPESDLMRFNSAPVASTEFIQGHMREVTRLSLDILVESEGYFDPSVGPLVSAWGFGAEGMELEPAAEEVAKLLSASGMKSLDYTKGQLTKLKEGFIDYSAIAKGYAVDRVAVLLSEQGYHRFMVEVGGEVRVAGFNQDGVRWRLGIEVPDLMTRKAYNVAHITNVALATSGDYRNFIDGKSGRYSHTINPKTGYPIANDIASVSVIRDTCAEADAWATALMAMGSAKAINFAESKGIAAYFILRKEDGFSAMKTPNMVQYLK